MTEPLPEEVIRDAEHALEAGDGAQEVARAYLEQAKRAEVVPELLDLLRQYDGPTADSLVLDRLLEDRRKRSGTRREGLVNLADVEPEGVRWLWPGRVPLGKLTLLDGDPGLLKSTINLDLAARLSVGAAMPDGANSEVDGPAGTVLLTAEDGLADTVRPRLDAAEGDPELVAVVRHVPTAEGDLRLPHIEDTPELKRALDAVDARLLVVDPLMAFLPADANSYRDQDVRRALAPLADLAENAGVAVIAVRHLNKSSGSNPKYRGGGSIGLIGAARSGLLVGKDPDAPETRRVLATTKANLSEHAPSLAYRPVQAKNGAVRVEWEGESEHSAHAVLDPPTGTERTARQEAADILREELRNGPRPVPELREVADRLGVTWRTVRRAADSIDVRKDKVGFGADGHWEWSLPSEEENDPEPGNTSQGEQKRVPLEGSGGREPPSGRNVSYPERGSVRLEDGPEGQGGSEGSTPYPDSGANGGRSKREAEPDLADLGLEDPDSDGAGELLDDLQGDLAEGA